MIRHIVLATLVAAIALPSAPAAAAQDDLVRQLIDACVGCRFPKDLHGRDLHGLRFVAADLRDVDFSRANLNGATFTGANLAGARFDDADLRNAQFVGVEFRGTSFARAKLDGVSMRGVRLGAGSIVGADYKRFLRDCGGCDLAEAPFTHYRSSYRFPGMSVVPVMPALPRITPIVVMTPELERALREVDRQFREHPPVIPREFIERSVRDAQINARSAERAMREAERASRDAVRGLERHQPAVPPLPTLPPLPPISPQSPPAAAPPAPPPAPPTPQG